MSADRRRVAVAFVLFVLTVGSTTLVDGPAYSATVMSILVAHEAGHYFAARHHGVPRSPPYFIPFPWGPLGTFGAVIWMSAEEAEAKEPTRNQLMDISAAGPILGFLVAVPAMIIGIRLSTVVKPDPSTTMSLGDSILSWALTALFGPDVPEGYDMFAHPIFKGAWAGFLVTAINLIPIGQLDGGHVLHAFAPERSSVWYRRFFALAAVLSAIGVVVFAAKLDLRRWFTPATIGMPALAYFLTGRDHPPVREIEAPLTPMRRWTALACLAVFVLTFMPSPAWEPLQ